MIPTLLRTRFLRTLLHAACTVLLVGGMSPTLAAGNPRFTGAWTLDAERSEEFGGLLDEFNDHLFQHVRKKKVESHGAFGGLGAELKDNNAYMGKEDQRKEALRHKERTKAKAWELAPEIRALLEAKEIRLDEGDKCAITYDQGTKRLVVIVSEDEAATLQAKPSTRDDIGRSTGHMEAGALVIDTDTTAGDRMIESFTLNDAGTEMTLTTKVRRSDVGKPIEFKRVYKRSE